MKIYATAFLFCFITIKSFSQLPKLQLNLFSSGYSSPVDIKNCGDSRLFIVQQNGYIYTCDSLGIKNATAFLDVHKLIVVSSEQGLLGLAFDPDYKTNRTFYVYYTKKGGTSDIRIVRYKTDSLNANKADTASAQILMSIPHPTYGNHNGGGIGFGPDNYLYFGTGDGGSGGDPNKNAQNPLKYLGKMIRIDVHKDSLYAVPLDNPFVDDATYYPEIWAVGMRNPWRFSWDRLTHDLWIGDVGQNIWEEVDFVSYPDTGGQNYGWDCYEAAHDFEPNNCAADDSLTWPIAEYKHQLGDNCVIGGYVYRGSQHQKLYGKYLFTDNGSGKFRMITHNSDNTFKLDSIGDALASPDGFVFSTFGEDRFGELYVANASKGYIYRIADTSTCSPVAQVLVNNGAGLGIDSIACIGSLLETPFGIGLTYQWQFDGADISGQTNSTISATDAGSYSVVVTNTEGCFSVSKTIEIGIPSAVSISGLDAIYCIGISQPDTLTGIPTGGIFSGDGIAGNIFDPDAAGFGLHNVYYNYTNEYGCVSIEGKEVFVDICNGENELWSKYGVSIFPNPSNNVLNCTIKNDAGNVSEISMYNIAGQKVYSNVAGVVADNHNTFSINVSSLANGVYELRMMVGNNLIKHKVVISH